MGALIYEKGVLKLVHPGRHIEIHREPIMAAEIMRRNPRHCITRPDVFQFPWIVVKPGSVLLPGRIFFIVPYHTIYNLIKSKTPSFQVQHFPHHDHYSSSMCPSYDHMSTKTCQTHKKLFTKRLHWKMYLCATEEKQSRYEVLPKGIGYRETHVFEIEKHLQEEESNIELSREDSGKESYEKDVVDLELLYEQVTMLKSCLRKSDSNRRLLNLKVSFNLPDKNEEKREDNETLQSLLGVEISDDSDTS